MSKGSYSSKVYAENSITDKTVAVTLLSTFYIHLKVHTLCPVRFFIDSGSAVNVLSKKRSWTLKLSDLFQYLFITKIKKWNMIFM